MAKSKDGKGFGQTFMNILSLNDPDDDYDDDGLFDDEIDLVEPKQPKPRKEKAAPAKPAPTSYSTSAKAQSAASYADDDDDDYEPSSYRKPRAAKSRSASGSGSKVVSMNRSSELIVIRPQDFNEAQTVTDFLKDGKPIVINMEGIEINTAQRIIDFIGGACYALDGTLGPVSNNIFIAAPQDVEVTGDLRDGLSSESMVSPYLGSL